VSIAAGFAYETFYLGRRTLVRFLRVPGNFLWVLLFPLIQLFVFSQLFKDIISLPGFAPGTSYLAYLAPGQITFTAFFATAWAGGNLLVDYRTGYLDKLRVAPINRMSILAGELVTLFVEAGAMAGAMLVLAVLLGASIATGIAGALLLLLLAGAFGVALGGISMIPALVTKNEQATGTIPLLIFPVAFMSTAFVPTALMPDWLQTLNQVNPVSYVIEGMRALMVSGFDWPVIGRAALVIVLLAAVLQGGTLWALRRLTG